MTGVVGKEYWYAYEDDNGDLWYHIYTVPYSAPETLLEHEAEEYDPNPRIELSYRESA